MASSLQTALIRVNDDVRNSMGIMPVNQTADSNAPSAMGDWLSGDTILVLGVKSTRVDGTLFNDSSAYDSIVYYLKDNVLYKRIIAFDDPDNRERTITCGAATPSGGCPADTVLVSGITDFKFTYFTKAGDETSDPMTASSVRTTVRLQTEQSGQAISYADSAMMTPRMNQKFADNAPFTAGLGGISMSYSTINGGPGTSIYSSGGLNPGQNTTIGSVDAPVARINLANRSCGTNASYGTSCAPSQPIPTSGSTIGFSSIYANRICAANQTSGTPGSTYAKLGVTGLVAGCAPNFRFQPVFDKAAHTSKMIPPALSAISCERIGPYGCSGPVELPANKKINGNVIARGNVTVNVRGNSYITGNLTFGDSSPGRTDIVVDPALVERPVIVVNGRIEFNNVRIVSDSGLTPIFVSFWSSDSSGRSQSDTYVDQDVGLIYDTLRLSFGRDVAIALGNLNTVLDGSFYAYFGGIQTNTSITVNGTIAGQRVNLGYRTTLNLARDPWNTLDSAQ